MFCFIQRAACNPNKSPVFLICTASIALGNTSANAVRRAHQLLTDRIAREMVPTPGNFSNGVCNIF
jgi:hypothetical protein